MIDTRVLTFDITVHHTVWRKGTALWMVLDSIERQFAYAEKYGDHPCPEQIVDGMDAFFGPQIPNQLGPINMTESRISDVAAAIDKNVLIELSAELESANKDAERYRKVRDMCSSGALPDEWREGYSDSELDDAIDAAMLDAKK